MDVRILGPLEVFVGGDLVDLGGPMLRRLLGALTLHVGQVVSTDRLVEILWGPDPRPGAAVTLQSHVSHLRDVLEPDRPRGEASRLLVTRPPGYLLAVDRDDVDGLRFERLADEGRRALAAGLPDEASATLRQALALWRGEPLADLSFEPFAQSEIVRLSELRLRALEDRIEADLALGRHGELAGELRGLVAEHPLRERLWSHLVLALYRGGRQAEALRAFAELRQILGEELGIEPSPELVRLEEGVLLQKPQLDWEPPSPAPARARTAARPEKGMAPQPGGLPLQLTSFIGRSEDVAAARRMLASTRLLTLTGTGGVGKTRLSLEVAGQWQANQGEAVFFVELAPLGDPSLVANRVASALDVREEPGVPVVVTLTSHLALRTALLVLDNCEHLLPSCAGFVETLLRSCPELRFLTTSREPLRVPGETVWRVRSLSIPSGEAGQQSETVISSESAQLFVDRARAAGGLARLSAQDVPALVRICQELEGIPLALELAAARSTFLSLPEMADRLGDRFRLLAGGAPVTPSRHQTLRAAVDWTYESLSSREKTLFNRLSVFVGGFTLDSAAEVCAGEAIAADAVMELISSLVDKSLVTAERGDARTRYRLLETLRQYGAEKLATVREEDGLRRRHLEWVVAFVEDCESRQWGPDAAAAAEDLQAELDNARQALRWAREAGAVQETLRVAGGLAKFWRLRGYFDEARTWLEAAVVASPTPSPARGKALLGLGSFALLQADHDAALRWLEAALRTWQELTDEIGVAEVLTFMGSMEQMKGHFAAATRLYEQSLESWRRAGGLHGVATSLDALLHNMGELAYEQGDLDAAASLFEQSIAASRQLGVTMPLIHPLTGLGQIARDRGDRAAATALFEDSLEIARRFGYRRGEAGSLQFLAQLALTDGDHRAAERRYSEALKVWSVVNDRLGIAWGLEGLAGAEVGLGDAERAATLLGAAEQLREVINTPPAPSELTDLGHTLQAARAAMEEGAFSVAWERGRSTPHEVVVAWALASDGRAAPADEGAPETAPPEPRSLSARQP